MSEVDRGRAGAHAAAVGRETEVATRVELGVQGRAGAGELLNDVADRGETGFFQLFAGNDGNRGLPFDFSLLDA